MAWKKKKRCKTHLRNNKRIERPSKNLLSSMVGEISEEKNGVGMGVGLVGLLCFAEIGRKMKRVLGLRL